MKLKLDANGNVVVENGMPVDEVIVNEKEATARSLLSLQTDVNGNKASINNLNQTFSDYQHATATQINGITATVNGHTSAITTNAQAIANVNGDLSAMYNIKVTRGTGSFS